jgi:hypothetical protein
MNSTNQAEDYQEFFLNKFKSLFKTFVEDTIDNLTDEKIKNNLIEIRQILHKLDYSKIMIKYAKNNELYKSLQSISQNNDKLSNNEKYWTLMPKISLNKILLNVKGEYKEKLLKLLNTMYVASLSYSKVYETDNNTEFDPYKSIGEVSKQLTIEEMYEGVEIKTPESYEFIMNQLLEKFNLNESLKDVNNKDIDDATNNINEFLSAKKNNPSANIISSMLENIKGEIMNLKNDSSLNNEDGMKKIFEIAKRVSTESIKGIDKSTINPLQLWDTTTELATNTTGSDTIAIFSDLIRSQIVEKMNVEK